MAGQGVDEARGAVADPLDQPKRVDRAPSAVRFDQEGGTASPAGVDAGNVGVVGLAAEPADLADRPLEYRGPPGAGADPDLEVDEPGHDLLLERDDHRDHAVSLTV